MLYSLIVISNVDSNYWFQIGNPITNNSDSLLFLPRTTLLVIVVSGSSNSSLKIQIPWIQTSRHDSTFRKRLGSSVTVSVASWISSLLATGSQRRGKLDEDNRVRVLSSFLVMEWFGEQMRNIVSQRRSSEGRAVRVILRWQWCVVNARGGRWACMMVGSYQTVIWGHARHEWVLNSGGERIWRLSPKGETVDDANTSYGMTIVNIDWRMPWAESSGLM